MRFHKVIFILVRDWFIRFEGLRRSVTVLVGFERGLIDDLACLRKKYLIRRQISSSKIILVRFHKVILILVKDWFIRFEGLHRSVTVLVGSERGLFVDLACLRKKYLTRCQVSSSITYFFCSFMKNDFEYSQGLVQIP